MLIISGVILVHVGAIRGPCWIHVEIARELVSAIRWLFEFIMFSVGHVGRPIWGPKLSISNCLRAFPTNLGPVWDQFGSFGGCFGAFVDNFNVMLVHVGTSLFHVGGV